MWLCTVPVYAIFLRHETDISIAISSLLRLQKTTDRTRLGSRPIIQSIRAYFGIYSNQSQHPWGKSCPYIAVATPNIILGLAWTIEIANFIGRCLGFLDIGVNVNNTTSLVAAVFVYGLSLAIQPVQGGMRALFIDSCATYQLEDISAWAARIAAIGNLLGYRSGFINLPEVLPFFGDILFKVLSYLASRTLVITIFPIYSIV